ncbi:MAG TPA: hypothetical protein VHC43_04680 [Mycobacteriales bacterium]|nr:hypothetical protein [Mycobacteriales bacterium]
MALAPTLSPWFAPAQRVSPDAAAGASLGADWFVVGATVVGPGGVFALHHGHRSEAYVRDVRGAAQRTERALADALGRRIPVVGLVTAFRAGKGFTVKAAPDGGPVVIVSPRKLQRWLDQTSVVLSPAEVAEIRDALRYAADAA